MGELVKDLNLDLDGQNLDDLINQIGGGSNAQNNAQSEEQKKKEEEDKK